MSLQELNFGHLNVLIVAYESAWLHKKDCGHVIPEEYIEVQIDMYHLYSAIHKYHESTINPMNIEMINTNSDNKNVSPNEKQIERVLVTFPTLVVGTLFHLWDI